MSALRTLRQLTATSSRHAICVQRVHLASLPRAALAAARTPAVATRTFTASARKLGEGTSGAALSQKLQAELDYEKEANAEFPATPEFLKAFQEQGLWQIDDVPGNDEVTLTRTFGNESIRLIFSIADIQSEEDEEYEEPQPDAESEEGSEDEPVHSYPIRASLSITKASAPGAGALNVDMICQEGHFVVDNITFYKDAELGTGLTSEADWKRRGLYLGPQFDTLDVAVQEEFEKYLQERGVNEHVALFIPEYAEFKEQKEYVKWLNNVKSFVEV